MAAKLGLNLVVDLGYNLNKCLFDIGRIKGTSFDKSHTAIVCVFLGFLKRYFAPVNKITLITYEQNNNVFFSVVHELSPPFIIYTLERFVARYVINEKSANCISIVSIGDSSISFLSGSVPNLGSHFRL